jgi:hypothetical protein
MTKLYVSEKSVINSKYLTSLQARLVTSRGSTNLTTSPQSTSTGCLKIYEFRIESVVGDHFSSPNMEIKINRSQGALFEVRFLQIQAEKFSVYCYLWSRWLWKIIT